MKRLRFSVLACVCILSAVVLVTVGCPTTGGNGDGDGTNSNNAISRLSLYGVEDGSSHIYRVFQDPDTGATVASFGTKDDKGKFLRFAGVCLATESGATATIYVDVLKVPDVFSSSTHKDYRPGKVVSSEGWVLSYYNYGQDGEIVDVLAEDPTGHEYPVQHIIMPAMADEGKDIELQIETDEIQKLQELAAAVSCTYTDVFSELGLTPSIEALDTISCNSDLLVDMFELRVEDLDDVGDATQGGSFEKVSQMMRSGSTIMSSIEDSINVVNEASVVGLWFVTSAQNPTWVGAFCVEPNETFSYMEFFYEGDDPEDALRIEGNYSEGAGKWEVETDGTYNLVVDEVFGIIEEGMHGAMNGIPSGDLDYFFVDGIWDTLVESRVLWERDLHKGFDKEEIVHFLYTPEFLDVFPDDGVGYFQPDDEVVWFGHFH